MITKKRLFGPIYSSYLMITLLSLLAVTWVGSKAFRSLYFEQVALDLQSRAHMLEQQFDAHVVPLDQPTIDFLCKTIGLRSGTRITVILPDGRVIGDSDEKPIKMENHANRPEIKTAYTGIIGKSVRFSNTLGKRMMYVALPLTRNDRVMAVIRTSLPVTTIDGAVTAFQLQAAVIGLIIAALAAGVWLLVSRRISRQLENMVDVAQALSRGDMNQRVIAPSSEELGELANVLNQMAMQLDNRIKTIVHQRNELEAVLSSMQEGVIAIDMNEQILSINQAAAQIFQGTPSDLQQRSIQEVVRNPDLNRFVKTALSSVTETKGDIVLYRGGERILHAHSTALKDAEGEHIGTLLVLNDVTQLRRLENMRKDFAANVSHEIKTPLTAIKGFVETLQHGDVKAPEEIRRFLGIIERHVNRLASIIEDLIHLSQIEQAGEKQELHFEDKPIVEIVQTAIHLCQDKAQAKHININYTGRDTLIMRVDATLLEQAFFNLLDNAINYSDADSTIEVRVKQKADQVVVEFEDHGIGIPPKNLSRLFERFYRVDKARSRKLGGTGLGLAIVKHIVQMHGGNVDVKSTPGVGSIFSVYLPVDAVQATSVVEVESPKALEREITAANNT
jgi:two-component system phosphate regulon sensor histidine kinase PhoR